MLIILSGPFSVEDLLSSYSIESLLVSPVNDYDLERLIAKGSMPANARMYSDGMPVQEPASAMGFSPADVVVSNGMTSMNMGVGRQDRHGLATH